MKILNAAQIRECDAFTIQSENITSTELMERAATNCVKWIRENLPKNSLFVVLCGTGNNGGDGLAITRMLHQRGIGVKAFLLNLNNELSDDCRINEARLKNADAQILNYVTEGTYITDIPKNIIIIDAIFGTGINRPITGWCAKFILEVNKLPNRKIAIDMPSGLPADSLPATTDSILKANETLSFQFFKRSMLHPESEAFAGNIHIIDIGLNKDFANSQHTQYHLTTYEEIKNKLKRRVKFAHKGTQGRVLIIGGSYGKIGAVVLSTTAALKSGAGLVTAMLPECGYNVIQNAVPEAMCETNGANVIENIPAISDNTTVGIGPGIGKDKLTANAVLSFLEDYTKPLVIDADALNIIADNPEILHKLPKDSILTPHPREFERLFGSNTNSMVQVDHARIQAMRYNINIVLKGHHTTIIDRDGECFYNTTGNPGMATAGSGDVLTGLITGLLAQGYTPREAAIIGVYIHGLAGDYAAELYSQEAMIAGDIIAQFGSAFKHLHGNAE